MLVYVIKVNINKEMNKRKFNCFENFIEMAME